MPVKSSPTWIVVGLMSGTSVDGIDAALVRLQSQSNGYALLDGTFRTYGFSTALRHQLLNAAEGATLPAAAFSRLSDELGEAFAAATLQLLQTAGVSPARVDLIGSHGHTIFHGPPRGRTTGTTWQIGTAPVIAARTGITTVADFRTRDVAHGGQGAPLAPYVHWLLFQHRRRNRVITNLGGIANPTFLPAGGRADDVIAFDAGPGNMLIDAVVTRLSNGRQRFDEDGVLGAAGETHSGLLSELMRHPFLRRRPPKSTGREEFGAPLVDRVFASAREHDLSEADIVATVTRFTARSLASACRRFIAPHGEIDEMFCCGGGRRNPTLMAMLREELNLDTVGPIEDIGVDGDSLEAMAFAVLAVETMRGRSGNLPRVTGAREQVLLGSVTPGAAMAWRRLLTRLR